MWSGDCSTLRPPRGARLGINRKRGLGDGWYGAKCMVLILDSRLREAARDKFPNSPPVAAVDYRACLGCRRPPQGADATVRTQSICGKTAKHIPKEGLGRFLRTNHHPPSAMREVSNASPWLANNAKHAPIRCVYEARRCRALARNFLSPSNRRDFTMDSGVWRISATSVRDRPST